LISHVKKANTQYTVTELCQLFELSPSTYYYHARPKPVDSKRVQAIAQIQETAEQTGNTYGKRRMQRVLAQQGIQMGLYKVSRLVKQAQVTAIRPVKKHRYAGGTVHKIAANLLNRQFNPARPMTHWVGDITYIHTAKGWSYLACVLDLYSREIVGWALSQTADAALAKAALTQAIRKQQPNTRQLLFHSDQCVQYSAQLFVDYLTTLNITQSMSRRGNCWDNAVMERFFRNLKTERLNHLHFLNQAAVHDCVQHYIWFYNYRRLHSAIDYMTPHQKNLSFLNVA